MGLHVDMLGSEDLLAALDGEVFNRIHVLAAPVVSFAGVPLRILVRHDGALGGQHGGTGEVFRSD